MHDQSKDSPVYRDHAGDGAELRRAMRHASAGLLPPTGLLFDAAETDWESFYTTRCAEDVVPHFVAAYRAAGAGEIERLIALDASFADDLPEVEHVRLAAASAVVFETRAGARALRLLDRLRERRPECSYPTAFAAHAAAFNVPLLHALIAYLAIEWRSGERAGSEALEKSRDWEKVFIERLQAGPVPVRQLLARSMGSWAEVA